MSRERALYLTTVLIAAITLALVPFLGLAPDEMRALFALAVVGVVYRLALIRAQMRFGWARLAPVVVPANVLLITLAFALLCRALPTYWVVYFVPLFAAALLYGKRWAYLAGILATFAYLAVMIVNHSITPESPEELLNAAVLLIFTVLAGQLAESEYRRAREQEALNTLATAINRSLTLDEVLRSTIAQISTTAQMDAAAIFTVESDQLVLRSHHGLSPEFLAGIRDFKVGEGITGRVAQSGKIEILTAGVRRDRRLTRQVVRRSDFEAYVGVPLITQGRVVGVMSLASRRARAFDADDLAFFQAIANQIATAIANARLYAESQSRARRLALLNEFAALVNRGLDLKTLLADAQRLVVELVQLKTVWVALGDSLDSIALAVDHNLPTALAADDKREMRWRPCLCQRMLFAGKLTEAVNIVKCERFEHAGVAAHHATVPLKSGDPSTGSGRVLGLLNVVTPSGEPLAQEDLQTLSAMGAQLGVAIERARLHEQVKARRIEEQAALLKLSQGLASLLDEDAILDRAAETAQEVFHADFVSLMFPDDPSSFDYRSGGAGSEHLILRAGRGWEKELYGNVRVDMATSWQGYVFRNDAPLQQEDVQTSTRFSCPTGLRERGIHATLTVPLTAERGTLGTLCVHFRARRTFGDDDVRLGSLIANQAALACERARLFTQAGERLERITALHDIDVAITSELTLEETLTVLLEKTAERLRVDAAAVALIKPETRALNYAAKHGLDGDFFRDGLLKVKEGIVGEVADSGTPIAISDVRAEPRFVRRPIAEKTGIVSYLAVPLQAHGEIIGVLELATRARHKFASEEVAFFETLAGQAAIAIEKARLFDETRRRAERLALVNQISGVINQPLALSDVLTNTLRELTRVLDVDRAAAATFAESREQLIVVAGHSTLAVAPTIGSMIPLRDNPSMDYVLGERRPLAVADAQHDPIMGSVAPVMQSAGVQSILILPLIVQDQIIGTIGLDSVRQPRVFAEDEIALAQTIAHQAAAAIERARLFEEEHDRRAELAALYDLSRDLADVAYDSDAILNLVTRRAVETVHTTFARVALVEDGECVLHAAFPVRGLERDLGVGRRVNIETMPLCFQAAQSNTPLVLHADDPRLSPSERDVLFLNLAQTLCLVPLRVGERALGLLMLGEARGEEREPFTAEKIRLAHSIGDQAASALHRAELFLELERSYLQTVLTLANAVDAKDTYTADHAQRLAEMALAVGQELGMSPRELEDLRYGAILHDIGKIGVPDAILKKPAKLDAEEWKIMRQHPEIGSRILAPVPRLEGAAKIVRHHHERYDGKGYPDGLAGDAIPLGARILTVVDSYSAIMDARVYKAARPQDEAITELKKNVGAQFDPRVVEIFLRLLERGVDITGGGRTLFFRSEKTIVHRAVDLLSGVGGPIWSGLSPVILNAIPIHCFL